MSSSAKRSTSASGRPKGKRIALKPPAPGPLPEGDRRHGEGPPDPLDALRKRIDRGEEIATPGRSRDSGDRDLHDEEWRPHDNSGPYGQRRRRRN
ncbi:hypothetical protein [Streptomyces sp. NPDC020742]|uniref:hypothetical protein n=1 Tax=unclassified Streptomyces TaxID=2593676 RepID=UPI0033E0D7DB